MSLLGMLSLKYAMILFMLVKSLCPYLVCYLLIGQASHGQLYIAYEENIIQVLKWD
jgi:hypothetical protein